MDFLESENNAGRFKCPKFEKCPFFQRHENIMSKLTKRLKSEYCLRDNTDCCRLWICRELGPESVPETLMPHQWDWAEQILRDAGKTEVIYKRVFSGDYKKKSL
jgi:hypothetical protein